MTKKYPTFVRGYTPSICFQLKQEVNLSDIIYKLFTIKQGSVVIKIEGNDVFIDGQIIGAKISQEDSLKLLKGSASVEAQWVYPNTERSGTYIYTIKIDDNHEPTVLIPVGTPESFRDNTYLSALIIEADVVGGGVPVTPDESKVMDVQWNQCSQRVMSYINNVDYNNVPYTESFITNYAPLPAISANTKPIGKLVDGVVYYNNIPGVKTPFASAGAAGTLMPLDQVRWINSSATNNFRDIGGWACDGGTVKYGLLYRSGNLGAADEDLILNDLGIKTEIDLTADGTPAYLNRMRYVGHTSYAMYTLGNEDAWKTNMRGVFDAVLYGDPVIVHCSMGADRTGTLICVLEALLGVNQSDIDKDYELSSFYALRARNGNYQGGTADWAHLISEINSLAGNTFRDKVVGFVLSLGFTIGEINAFRSAMINGTPEVLTANTNIYLVTNTLTNVTTNNGAGIALQYQPYEATITPDLGYVIDDVSIMMGGQLITDAVWSGEKTTLNLSVKNNLTNCNTNNNRRDVISGQSYGAKITAHTGYTLDGAEVTILMGGINVSEYYSNGTITIPNVTGDLVITVSAVATAPENLFNILEATDGVRINSSGEDVSYSEGQLTTGYINAVSGDVIYIESDKSQLTNNYTGMLACYLSDGTHIGGNIGNDAITTWHWSDDYKKGYITIPTVLNSQNYSSTVKVRLCLAYEESDSIVIYKMRTPPSLS